MLGVQISALVGLFERAKVLRPPLILTIAAQLRLIALECD